MARTGGETDWQDWPCCVRISDRHVAAHRSGQQKTRVASCRPRRIGAARAGSRRPRNLRRDAIGIRRGAAKRAAHAQALVDVAESFQRDWQRLLGRNSAPCQTLADETVHRAQRRGNRRALPIHARGAHGMVRTPGRTSRRAFPGARHCAFGRRWRRTENSASLAQSAARRFSALSTPRTKPIIARRVRLAENCSRTARSRGCCAAIGRKHWRRWRN